MSNVTIWEENVVIPTYEIGEAQKAPMFLEKRVYQASSGKVYPYPTVETISDEKVDKEYKAVFLENEYIKIMVLPELGGRIQRAYDKTNGYDFVYYNHVIKPALVGLTGPWISGGIEFNWPQHHRPTTFLPVDYVLQENQDGSRTLRVNDVDQMYGTKGVTSFTLYPGKAYIEIQGQVYNGTAYPQTFLWWANPAIPANAYTQSIFPPDVHAVMDHGKRDVSRFPIATGVYYKHDYSEGVDISRFKNIPVPTSYMAEKSDYDFVGGYDHQKKAGILHVADHHISPGKKQWTWGCGDFGKAWDRNLTDEDGPYIELMTGVFTDNQPDFTWLKPFEEKSFKQYFMPYKAVGNVKNATIKAAINMEKVEHGIYLCVYATREYKEARIVLQKQETTVFEEYAKISPTEIYEKIVPLHMECEYDWKITVWAGEERLVEYQPKDQGIPTIPKPAQEAKPPKEIMTTEELYLTGLHIEQYRHATYLPDPYYLEGLQRDEGDIRLNNAYGLLLLRRGCFIQAETYFRKGLERLTWKNPNPYSSEVLYNLGVCLLHQQRLEEAYDLFYKATWSNEQQEMSFYYLAAIASQKGELESAYEFIEKALVKNSHNRKARGLKAYLLRKANRKEEAVQWCQENLSLDPFDYLSRYELSLSSKENGSQLLEECRRLMRNFSESYLQVARDYAVAGAYQEAVDFLPLCTQENPMLSYYVAYYKEKLGEDSSENIKLAEATCSDYCFPNKIEDIAVLQYAIASNNLTPMANYYLGNVFYDKLQYDRATALWEESNKIAGDFPLCLRNLALAYYNQFNKADKAVVCLEKAYRLDQTDARMFLELDQLYQKIGKSVEERLIFYEAHTEIVKKRDDLCVEYITMLNYVGNHRKALALLKNRKFHPWEGGEGKVTNQYTIAYVDMAKEAILAGEYKKAQENLKCAFQYPENLGEGRLEGTKENHIYYYLGCVYEKLGDQKKAEECFETATIGTDEPAGMMYYYDQPADMILYQGLAKQKLGKKAEANARFYRLIDFGEKHLNEEKKIEYFAVSLPDLSVFEQDLNQANRVHCYYLMGLGKLGLQLYEEARQYFLKALQLEPSHLNCRRYLNLCDVVEKNR